MRSKIVLVITDQETNAQIYKLGIGLLELRVDLFKGVIARSGSDEAIFYAKSQFQVRRKLNIPLILTVRDQKNEGAQKAMAITRKWELLQALMPLTDWVDIEYSSLLRTQTIALARKLKKKVAISMHDFKHMPDHLEQHLRKALSLRADMVKIAVNAHSSDDFMRMVEFTLDHRKQPLATMCVGRWGGVSRLVLPALGSRWVYTFLNKPTVPGQMDVHTLKDHMQGLYR